MASYIAVKKLDEVDVASQMQAHSSVADLMSALVFDAVDTNLHIVGEHKPALAI